MMDTEDKNSGTRSSGGVTAQATSVDFDRPDSLVGQRLDGRFRIEANLTEGGADEGGIGVVYLAKDTKMMDKRVVVKILQEAALKYKDILRKFQHEREALIRIDHAGIVRILDFGTLSDGNPFIVMEYIEGHSLRKALRTQGQLPLDVAAHLVESITDALAAAHAEKVLHRDIKPENIMLTPQKDGFDRVRLIDFGIAHVEESELAPATEVSRAIGTIRYISPEQLVGNLYMTPAADIYSAAVVAYEMLVGRLPLRPETMADMYRLQQAGQITPPREIRPEVPAAAEAVLMSALEFDAEKRPQDARAWGRDLARSLRSARLAPLYETEDLSTYRTELAGDEVVTAHRPSAVTAGTGSETKPKPLFKWAVAGVIAFVVLTVTSGIVLWNIIGTGGPVAATPGNSVNTAPPGAPEREISYHLVIQKMRGGARVGDPIQLAGQEYLAEPGWKISMVFAADTDGYFYLWNEGKSEEGTLGYYPLFPTPRINAGSSRAVAGQQIETGQNTFTGSTGTEVFYLVWSKEQPSDLDAIWKSIPAGQNSIEGAEKIKTLLAFQARYVAEKPVAEKDEVNRAMRLKSKGDVLVWRFTVEQQ